MLLGVPKNKVGKKAKCPHCGQIIRVVPDIEIQTSDYDHVPTTVNSPKSQVPHWVWRLLIGWGVLMGIIFIYFFFLRDTWEWDNSQKIKALADQASSLYYSKNSQQALNTYDDLFKFIANKQLKNKYLKGIIDEATQTCNKAKEDYINQHSSSLKNARNQIMQWNYQYAIDRCGEILNETNACRLKWDELDKFVQNVQSVKADAEDRMRKQNDANEQARLAEKERLRRWKEDQTLTQMTTMEAIVEELKRRQDVADTLVEEKKYKEAINRYDEIIQTASRYQAVDDIKDLVRSVESSKSYVETRLNDHTESYSSETKQDTQYEGTKASSDPETDRIWSFLGQGGLWAIGYGGLLAIGIYYIERDVHNITLSKIVLGAASVPIVLWGLSFIGCIASDLKHPAEESFAWILLLPALTASTIAICIVCDQCPKCKKYLGSEEISSAVINEQLGTRTVTHRDEVTNNRGENIGYISRNEQVQTLIQDVSVTSQCKFCGYVSNRLVRKESEL
jgi:hypothetical protein